MAVPALSDPLIFCGTTLLTEGLFGELPLQGVLAYSILTALAIALRVFCERGASKASFRASMDVKRILRDRIYAKLLRLGASYRESVSTSEVVQLSGEGVDQLETYFGRYLPQLFYKPAGPGDAVCRAVLRKPSGQPGASGLRAADSGVYCGSSENSGKAAGKILGDLYGAGRQLSGKHSGAYYSENLSGG